MGKLELTVDGKNDKSRTRESNHGQRPEKDYEKLMADDAK